MYIKLIFLLGILFIYSGGHGSAVFGQEADKFAAEPFQKCWETSETDTIHIASDNVSNLFIQNSSGQIKSLDVFGNENWTLELGGRFIKHPQFQTDTLYMLSKTEINGISETDSEIDTGDTYRQDNLKSDSYFVSAVNSANGIVRWRKDFKSSKEPLLLLNGKTLIISLSEGDFSKLSALNILDGIQTYEKNLDFTISKFFGVTDNLLMFAGSDHQIGIVSLPEGKVRLFNNDFKSIQTGLLNGDSAILSDAGGYLYLVNFSGTSADIKIRFGGRVSSILSNGGRFLISSHDNFLYSISKDAKKILWKKRFAGRITEKPVIAENVLILSSQGDNTLYFLNPEDGKVLNQISLSAGEEFSGGPSVLGSILVVDTNKGIRAYSSSKCENRTSTK